MSWLDELEELEKKATQGKWIESCGSNAEGDGPVAWIHNADGSMMTELSHEDGALAVAARNALPRLLRIARAAEELAAWTDECEQTISNDYLTAKYWAALKALREAVRDE